MNTDQRRARRETQRRRRARRRAWGLAAVGLLALAALLVGLLSGGGGPTRSSSLNDSANMGSGARAAARAGHAGHSAATGSSTAAGSSGATGSSTGSGSAKTRSESTSGGGASTATTPGAPSGRPGGGSVPILMYHVINPPPAGAKFPGLYVSGEEFAAQVQALAQAGFHAVTMDQMLAYWTNGTPLPAGKPIVLSFDNGYQSQLTNALPILRRLGWVGVENMQLTGLPPAQGGLSEGQIKQLVAAGWELDTQGISHAELTALDPAALRQQVAVARTEVQRRYHVPVNWFCYPSGHYNATVIAAVKAAGYAGSTTVVPGWASPSEDRYRLPRLRVLGGTSPRSLLEEIAAIRSNPVPPPSYEAGE